MNASSSSKICRICCNQKINDQVSLLDAENRTIVKKLRACADITIEHDDLLPKYICKKCLKNLNAAYSFKIQCEYMDQKFRDTFENGLQKHAGYKSTDLRESSSFEYNSSDATDSCEFDHGQNTMNNDRRTDNEEDYNKPGTSFNNNKNPFAHYHTETQDNQVANVQILPFIKHNFEMDAMEISPRPTEIEKLDSFESLTDVKGPDDFTDQEMISLKSERIAHSNFKHLFKCDTCDATFMNHNEYKKHVKTHDTNRYQCKIPTCKRSFTKKYLLNAHQKTHNGMKLFECLSCKKRYTTQTNLDRHIRIYHKKELTHTCITCKKTFSLLSTLRLHQSVHVGRQEFGCDMCDSKFKTEVQLKLHKKRHLPTEYRPKRKYAPPTPTAPKKVFKSSQKPCSCSECGKRFSNIALLRSHMQCHSTEKKYECNFCKKRFSFQSTLRNHIYLHTGEKRFKCDVCHVSFRQIGHLQGHRLVHSGTRPHSCSVCGKAFALRSNLTVHMRIHTGITPYHCRICPKKFSDSNALKRHHLVHQRNIETNPTIQEILEAPIVEEPEAEQSTIQETIIQSPNVQTSIIQPSVLQTSTLQEPISQASTFDPSSPFNFTPGIIQCIPSSELTGTDKDFIFRIQ